MMSIREILDLQRKERTADMEIALQDFLELTPLEQQEFIMVALLYAVRDTEWCKKILSEMRDG